MARLTFALLALAFLLPAGAGAAADPARHFTGAYSFSDELGGFRIRGVSGNGSNADPIVIALDLVSASAVTLVIRTETPIRPLTNDGYFANGFVRLAVVARNASRLAWSEFEFELQEILGKPSDFGDGLSFDQRRTDGKNITSSRFASFVRAFEPADRLRFTDGHVDPGDEAEFAFLVSDFTPRPVFYLVLDPRIPSS